MFKNTISKMEYFKDKFPKTFFYRKVNLNSYKVSDFKSNFRYNVLQDQI